MNTSFRNFSLFLFTFVTVCSACKQNNQEVNAEQELIKTKWNEEDHQGVKAAIEDYVEGLYLVDSTRIIKSVDTTLRKLGYWYNPKDSSYYDNLYMSHKSLVSLAAKWNSEGTEADENSIKKIEIYDVNSKTASAKLTAVWGIDYFHLGKVNGKWKIYNVIWQSTPD